MNCERCTSGKMRESRYVCGAHKLPPINARAGYIVRAAMKVLRAERVDIHIRRCVRVQSISTRAISRHRRGVKGGSSRYSSRRARCRTTKITDDEASDSEDKRGKRRAARKQ